MSDEPIPIVNPAVRRCDRKIAEGSYCDNEGTWIPVLLLYPSVLHGPSPPMMVQLDLGYCGRHKDDVTVKELATDRIYDLAEKACANAGKTWPERTLTRLKWIKWADSQLGKIKTKELAEQN